MSTEHPDTEPDIGLSLPAGVLAAVEAVINQLLALDPEGAARLSTIQGRVLRLDVTGFNLRLYVIPGDSTLMLYDEYATEPDCIVRGTPAALLRMALAEHREDEVFAGAIQITGDNQTAQALGDVLKGLDIDWEEQLSRVVGDALAHRIGNRARATGRWSSHAADTLTQDLREYLIDEGRILPSEREMDQFLLDVDALRDDVERLEARISRLSRQGKRASTH